MATGIVPKIITIPIFKFITLNSGTISPESLALHHRKKWHNGDRIIHLSFQHSENQGRLLENLVYLELKRKTKSVYYHQSKVECDFVIKEKNRITQAIQVCWSLYDDHTRQREISGLLDAMAAYQLKEGLILTEDENDNLTINDKSITIMPVWRWLLQ